MNPQRLAFLFTLSALLVLPPAAAERAYGPGFLRPDEVLQCLRDREQVVQRHEALTQQKAAIEQNAARIEEAEQRLLALQAEMDRDRAGLAAMRAQFKVPEEELDAHLRQVQDFKRARAAFEQKVKSYNDGVRAQQARREPHNRSVLALNADLAQYDLRKNEVDGRCTGKQSYQDDVQKAKEVLAEEEALRRR